MDFISQARAILDSLTPALLWNIAESLRYLLPVVLLFLAYGKTNKEIVAILNVSVRTIETYRARLMLKGNLHSVPHLVRCAFRNNVI